MKKFYALLMVVAFMFSACANGGTTQTSSTGPASTDTTGNTSSTTEANAAGDAAVGDNAVSDAEVGDAEFGDTAPADISGDLLVWIDLDTFAQAVIEGFNAKYPNVNVQNELVGLDANAKLSLDGPAGIGPDVLTLQDGAITNSIADGLLEPFPPALAAIVQDKIHETPVSVATYDGSIYGVPFTIEHISLYYNKDLVGIPATTIEEIIEFAKTYNDPSSGKYAMRFLPGDGFHSLAFTTTFGFRPFGPYGDDWKNPGFDSKEMTEALTFINNNLKAVFDYTSADANWDGVVAAFQRGEAPYCITGPWAAPGAMAAGLNFGTTKLPTVNGVQPNVFSASRIITVSSYAKNFDAAFAFAEYITSDEAAGYVYNVIGALPALKDLSSIEGFAEDEVIRGMAEQAPYTIPALNIPEAQFIWEPWMELHSFSWDGLLSIEDAQQKAMESYELLLNTAGLSMFD